MKKAIIFLLLILALVFTTIYRDDITHYVAVNYIYKQEIIEQNSNVYKLDYNFNYLKQSDNFIPKNKTELKNVLFTILNNGYEEFTFFCDIDYKDCIEDINEFASDDEILSSFNNFVHPYNNYNIVYLNYNNFGKVDIKFEKLYKENEINALNKIVDTIYTELINENMSDKEKILKIHDYIIVNTSYDHERADSIINENKNYVPLYQSNKAIGPLLQNMGICGGYSDAMALFLNKMNIPNLRVANEIHIWNLVKLDNKWYHLDLTWDDPTNQTEKDLIIHSYFLIDTEKLKSINNNHHFDERIYIEAKPQKNT